jgi:hypothetical protein
MAMNDFSISHGSWKKGALAAVGGVIKYVVVPILIVLGMITVMERAGVEELIESLGLRSLVMQVAILGEVVAALSFFRGFYPKGSLSRMTFGVISMAAAGVWLWTIVKGGDIALTSGELDLGVRYTSIVLLLLVAVALRGGYYVAEMLSHRKEWLDTL